MQPPSKPSDRPGRYTRKFPHPAYIIYAVIVVIFIFNFFTRRNLFGAGFIYADDYPIHIFRTLYFKNTVIPVFGGTFGYCFYFYAGYPVIHIYPIGLYMLTAFISFFGVPVPVALRIVIILLMTAYCLYPVVIASKVWRNPGAAAAAGVIFLFMPKFRLWYTFFDAGMLPFLAASILTVLAAPTAPEEGKRSAVFPDNLSRCLSSALTVAAAFLFNFMVIFFLIPHIVSVILLLRIFGKNISVSPEDSNTVIGTDIGRKKHAGRRGHFTFRKERTGSENGISAPNGVLSLREIKRWVIIAALSFGLCAFWILPTVFIQWPMVRFHPEREVFSEDAVIKLFGYLVPNLPWMAAVNTAAIVSIVYGLKKYGGVGISDKKRAEVVSAVKYGSGTLLALLFVLILPPLNLPFFTGINIARYYLFFELYGLPAAVFALKFLYRDLVRIFTRKKHIAGYRIPPAKPFLTALILLAAVYTVVPGGGNAYINFYDDTVNRFPADSNVLPEDVNAALNFLAEHSEGGRILFEDSGEDSGTVFGGFIQSLYPYLTDRTFIGGYNAHFWYEYAENASCTDGKAFGIPFDEMNDSFFDRKLEMYNIHILAVWSEDAVGYLDNRSDDFDSIANFGRIHIYKYRYDDFGYTHCDREGVNITVEKFGPDRIVLNIRGYTPGARITVKFHPTPNWFLKINGTDTEFDRTGELAVFSANISGNFTAEFYWRKLPPEIIGEIISIATLPTVLLFRLIPPAKTLYRRYIKSRAVRRKGR